MMLRLFGVAVLVVFAGCKGGDESDPTRVAAVDTAAFVADSATATASGVRVMLPTKSKGLTKDQAAALDRSASLLPQTPFNASAAQHATFLFQDKAMIPPASVLLGYGFNTATGQGRGECVVYDGLASPGGAAAQETVKEMNEIKSLRTLKQSLNLDAAASFSYGVFSGTAESSFLSSESFNNYSSYLYVHVGVRNAPEITKGPHLSPAALARLRPRTGMLDFINFCGDEFVYRRQTGGEFTAIVQFTSSSGTQQQSTSTKIQAAVKGFLIGSLEFSASMKSALEAQQSSSETKVFVLRRGTEEAIPPLDQLGTYADNFPTRVRAGGNPIVLSMDTKPLSTLPDLPVDRQDFTLVTRQRRALENLAEALDSAYVIAGNIAFIIGHRTQFAQMDDALLARSQSNNRDLIRRLRDQAQDCLQAVNQCPSSTVLPASGALPARSGATPVQDTPTPAAPRMEIHPDKQDWTEVGVVGDRPKMLEASGSWRVGAGSWACYGPSGMPTGNPYNRPVGFSGLSVRYLDANTGEVLEEFVHPGGEVRTRPYVKVLVRMNDVDGWFGDNLQCAPPMKVLLY